MLNLGVQSGLTVPFPSPPCEVTGIGDVTTEEAGLRPQPGTAPRVSLMVDEDTIVAQGAPVAHLRDNPDVRFVAPMPARVARISLLQGHKLSEIVFFYEPGGDIISHDAEDAGTELGLRRLMQRAGFWPWLRRRPFGGMPSADERPAAIFVMATDTRPFAPDPCKTLEGQQEALGRGLHALFLLTNGPVFLCQKPDSDPIDSIDAQRVRVIKTGPRHPQGAAGMCIHRHCPAGIDTPIWDLHAEDVAALGTLLATGQLPMKRLVSVGGPALRESRLVRAQAGADLRGLTHRHVLPGPHKLLSGSLLDGHPAHWLAPRHRQVTVLPREASPMRQHWLIASLTRSSSPKPVIPTVALDQAFAGTLPAANFLRALSAGDDETAMKMDVLSMLEEDIALADYVLGGEAHLPELLRGMLDRIRAEFAA